jgi:hypothetical protein
MAGQCCVSGRPSKLRPLSKAVASILPAAALALLPKCPLCLAGWLTVATGIGFSATGAAWLRGIFAVLLVAAMALAAAPIVLRRVFGAARLTRT